MQKISTSQDQHNQPTHLLFLLKKFKIYIKKKQEQGIGGEEPGWWRAKMDLFPLRWWSVRVQVLVSPCNHGITRSSYICCASCVMVPPLTVSLQFSSSCSTSGNSACPPSLVASGWEQGEGRVEEGGGEGRWSKGLKKVKCILIWKLWLNWG